MSDQNETVYVVTPEESGQRLDVFLLAHAPGEVSRAVVQRAVRDEKIRVDEKQRVKPGVTIHTGQTIRIAAGALEPAAPVTPEPDATIPLHILHEDPQLLVVDKPAGIPVHAGIRHEHHTLVDALLARYPGLAAVGDDPTRPGIVHRLDKDTSGVLLVARTPEMFNYLKRAFQERYVKKHYLALVRGVVNEDDGIIKLSLKRSPRNPLRRTVTKEKDGKDAETQFRVRTRFPHYTLLDVFPVTGRMHQIRVHLAHIGFPIIGDPLYGKPVKDSLLPPLRRQFLHAASLTLVMPSGKKKTFESPLPEDLQGIIAILEEDMKNRPVKEAPITFRPWRHSGGNRR